MYVAVKGGERAIANAHALLEERRRGNPALSEIITAKLGEGWVTDLPRLTQLSNDPPLRSAFMKAKHVNKERLAAFVEKGSGIHLSPQALFDVQSLGILPAGAFFPAPKVESEALIFRPKAQGPANYYALHRLVKLAFIQRRKKLTRNLEHEFPRNRVEEAFRRLGLNEQARAEQLSVQDFENLTRLLVDGTPKAD